MNKEEIRQLVIDIEDYLPFDFKNRKQQEKIREISKKYLESKFLINDEANEEDYMKFFKSIMHEIENGDYNYFLQLIDTRYVRSVMGLMCFSTKVEDIKTIIENTKNVCYKVSLSNLMLATQDINYIKDCIKNKEEFGFVVKEILWLMINKNNIELLKSCIEDKNLGLSLDDVRSLIYTVKEDGYIKIFLENKENLGLSPEDVRHLISKLESQEYIEKIIEDRKKLGLSSTDIQDLIFKLEREEYIKKIIEEREDLGLRSYHIQDLLKKIKDKTYIKSCLENREKLGLSSDNVINLICRSNDATFIKSCVEDRERLGLSSVDLAICFYSIEDEDVMKSCIEDREKLGLSSSYIQTFLFRIKDTVFVKSCIEDREKLGLSSIEVEGLILEKEDEVFTKSCIEDREKLGLSLDFTIGLIFNLKDEDYIKSCVENSKKIGLNNKNVIDLILSIKDNEYTKSCVKDREKLGLASSTLTRLILEVNDETYMKSCIEDREKLGLDSSTLIILILKVNDEDYMKSCIEDRKKLGLGIEDVRQLIFEIQDETFIKRCVKDREKLGLSSDNAIDLIIKTQDEAYIKSCIEDRKKLDLDSDVVKKLIIAKQDMEYVKSCIEDREKLGLNSSEVVELILLTGDLEYIVEQEKNGEKLKLDKSDIERLGLFIKSTRINLPKNMTIGVEIETEGKKTPEEIGEIMTRFLGKIKWEAESDGSLVNGTEVVSPILTEDFENASDEIRKVCAILSAVGQTVSERCGGHIHIGADYLTSKQDFVNLIEIWSNAEKVLYIIGNEKGSIPRDGVLEYASPISKKIEDAIKNGTIDLESEEDLDEFVETVSEIQGDRYSGINFYNVGNSNKNTIEFRMPNGTMNPNTWIENINLFGGIIRSAHDLSIIQNKPEEQRTETEKKMLEKFEILQTVETNKEIEIALIEMCIPEEQRQIYMERYGLNKEILSKSPVTEELISEQISTNKIGAKVFKGKNAVNGIDYQQCAETIEQELERSETTKTDRKE